MWAWQNLFLDIPKEEGVETMKSSRSWEITKPKFAIIDANVHLTFLSTDTGTQTLDKPLDETQGQDNLQTPDETKEIQPESESEDKTKEIQAESESEDKTKEIQTDSESEAKTKETLTDSESEDKTKLLDLQPQGGTDIQDETKLQEESKPQDGEKKRGWIITKEKLPAFCEDHNCLLSDLSEMPRVTYGDFVVHVEMDEPGEKLMEKAKQELREMQEIMDHSIKVLQELLREEQLKEGLKVPVDNVAWLKRFLRPTHYYPDSAFLKVKAYFEFKIRNDKHIELYHDLKPSNIENLFNHDIMTVLPVRDQNGCRILVLEIGRKWDYNVCTLDDIYKGSHVFLEAALLEPETQICGTNLLFDMDGLDNWQIWHFMINPSFTLRVVEFLQNVAPLRIKGLHIVNEPSTFGKLLKLFTVLMQAKLKSRIHIHGKDWASLHKHIDADCLPPEYGGTCEAPRISGPEWLEALSIMDKEYEALSSYGYKREIN